ncbi:hypothetical protein EIP91_012263 [Steccherinum ochraceum]|uniref:N-acetyltransferase domain-containing protein n=1 Tax=Steccherinum ochraceum TaxID=92696 RepID=A0A4R0RJB0_9APHY|nr:hypothetical protein EIP91_012263 [Steccherinum ochraceum]
MATIPEHEIIIINPADSKDGWKALRQQCYDVRLDVFHHEQGFSAVLEFDELEDCSTHILLRLVPSLKPVGTIRYTKFKEYSKLSRLAVLKDYRQYKLGRALVETLHRYAISDATKALKSAGDGTNTENVIRIVSNSQLPVKPFYAK